MDNVMEKSLEIPSIMNLSRISMDSLLGGANQEKNLSFGGMIDNKQPVPIVDIDVWFYLDPNHLIQGPFDTESMRLWNIANYFQNDLPIKMQVWNTFYPLGLVFSVSSSAFREIPPEPNQSQYNSYMEQLEQQKQDQQKLEIARQSMEKSLALDHQHKQNMLEQQMSIQQQEHMLEHQRAEQMRQEQHRQEQQQQEQQKQEQMRNEQIRHEQQMREQELQLQEDCRRRELELAEEIKLEHLRNQQAQQQLLKEQERQRQQQVENIDTSPRRAPSAPWTSAASAKTLPSKMTLQAIQQQESLLFQKKQQELSQQQANTFNKTGWNTTPITVNSTPSVINIQAEEANQRGTQLHQRQHQEREIQRNEASSSQLKSLLGVNLANLGQQQLPAGGWKTTAVPPKEKKSSLLDIMKEEVKHTGVASNSTSPRPPVATSWASKAGSISNSNWATNTAAVNNTVSIPTMALDTREMERKEIKALKVVSPKSTSEGKKSKASFGGSAMPGDMADWCSVQLKKINNSDDLTLVEFCMSLGSAVEIREYLAAYLGSTPQVSQFATEFIKKKDGKSTGMISQSAVTAPDSRKTPMMTVTKKKKGGNN
jgi:hypothetical protein